MIKVIKNKSCSLVLASMLLALGVSGVQAQEATVRSESSSRLSTVDGRVDKVLDKYKQRIDVLKQEKDKLVKCASKGLVYKPGVGADSDGCVYATEKDPHVADFARTDVGMPECGSNSFLKSVGKYEFACEDAAPYIEVPACTSGYIKVSSKYGSVDVSCNVSLPTEVLGGKRTVGCSDRKYDITANFVCSGVTGSNTTGWSELSASARQDRYDDCARQNVNVAGRCVADTGSVIGHLKSKGVACQNGIEHTTATATCNDGSLSLTNIVSKNVYDGTWSLSGWSACTSGQRTRTAVCTGGTCDPSLRPADTSEPCYDGTWSAGSYGSCSGSCGGGTGTQSRSVTCSNGNCDPATKPSTSTSCVNNTACAPVYTGSWSAGSYGSCSGACGGGTGTQSRSVTCSNGNCDPSTKPSTSTSCVNNTACPKLSCGGTTTAFGACHLSTVAHGGSSGTCASGYSGSCSYTCNNGMWTYQSYGCNKVMRSCPSQTIPSWSNGPASCGNVSPLPAAAHGSTHVETDNEGGAQGSVTYKCNDGSWQKVSSTCVLACSGKSVTLSSSGASCSVTAWLAHGASSSYSCTDSSPAGTLTGTVSCNNGSVSASGVSFKADPVALYWDSGIRISTGPKITNNDYACAMMEQRTNQGRKTGTCTTKGETNTYYNPSLTKNGRGGYWSCNDATYRQTCQ